MSQRSSKRRATHRPVAQPVDHTDGPKILQHNFDRSRRAQERRAAADASPPSTKTEAIYRALISLGDPSASSRQVADYVRTTWPAQAEFTEHANWNQFVTQTRDRAARALGVERREIRSGGPRPAEPGAASNVALPDLLTLLCVRSLLRDPESLDEVLSLISGLKPPLRLMRATSALEELLKRHKGDADAVQRFLEDLQQLRIRTE